MLKFSAFIPFVCEIRYSNALLKKASKLPSFLTCLMFCMVAASQQYSPESEQDLVLEMQMDVARNLENVECLRVRTLVSILLVLCTHSSLNSSHGFLAGWELYRKLNNMTPIITG